MNTENMALVMIPKEEWTGLLAAQEDILQQLKDLNTNSRSDIPLKYVTAKEFMCTVRIKRTKFDQLVSTNKIKIIKKKRKIYVPISEIDRYFNDKSIA